MLEVKIGTKQLGVTTAEWFTYGLIVIVLASTAYGFYFNYTFKNVIAAAVMHGELQKAQIESYFEREGEMPVSDTDAGIDSFNPSGVLRDMHWRAGVLGVPDSDKQLTGTLIGIVDLSEHGARFEDTETGFLLIARAEDEGITWECTADLADKEALASRYLPETCQKDEDSEDE